MCGLFGGYSTILSKDELSVITELGILSLLRGIDSTGILVAFKEPKDKQKGRTQDRIRVAYRKTLDDSFTFMTSNETKSLLENLTFRMLLMGHTRAATIGDVTVDNAQPFRVKHIIGCHNGTVHGWKKKAEDGGCTDSYILMQRIAEDGPEDALRSAHHGAYAVSFLDQNTRTLTFARNYDRPLHFMFSKHGDVVYWASEEGMLDLVATRRPSKKFEEPFLLKPHILYKFPLGERPTEAQVDDKVNLIPRSWYSTTKSKFSHPSWDEFDFDKASDHKNKPGRSVTVYPHPYQSGVTGKKKVDPPFTPDDKKKKEPDHPGVSVVVDPKTGKVDVVEKFNPHNVTKPAKPVETLHPFTGTITDNEPHPFELPETQEGCYVYWQQESMTAWEAELLLSQGCLWCGDPQLLEDIVWWCGKEEFVCNDCIKDGFVQEYIQTADQVSRGRLTEKPFGYLKA